MNNRKKNNESLHAKAIRLLEGGIVSVQGLSVKVVERKWIFDPCFHCEMDSICDPESEMSELCRECDKISHKDCYLDLVQ